MNAKKVYADLSKLGNGPVSTWDGNTKTMTWTATSNNMISNFDYSARDYRGYATISITVSDLDNAVGIRLQIKANGQEKLVTLNGNGSFTKNLISDFGFTSSDLAHVEWIRVLGSAWQNGESHTIDAEHPASAVISDVYLDEPVRTLDVNLSKMASSEGKATWNKDTKVFAWTLNYSNAITLPALSGNLSSFKKINYNTAAGSSENFRILIYYNNGAAQTTYSAAVGNKSVTFAEMGVSAENLSHVSSIKIAGASTPSGDIVLNGISLEGPVVNRIEETTVEEAPEGVTDLNGMTGADDNKWSIVYPLSVGDGTQFGGNIDGDNKSVNISAYDYLLFVVSEASADAKTYLRVFVSSSSSNDNSTRVILYPHPIADYDKVDKDKWTEETTITTKGVYVVKISDYPLLRGIKNKAYWQGSAGTSTISMAYVGSGSPVAPVENTVRVGEEALGDTHATCFDVSSLEGSGMTFNATNPNALFMANAGELTNTKNVIVDGSCSNFALTDGTTPFSSSVQFTATSVSYDRTFTEGQRSTVCLPYALTKEEVEAAGEFYELTDVEGSKLVFNKIEDGTEAYKPYIFKAKTDGALANLSNKAIPASVSAELSYEVSGYTFKGVLANSSDVAADNPGMTVYGWDAETGDFIKVGENVSINAFRAYITISNEKANPARLAAKFVDDSITGINEVNGSEAKNADGKFFENGKIVIIKNGVKYSAAGALLK